jgi:hypothetical protein
MLTAMKGIFWTVAALALAACGAGSAATDAGPSADAPPALSIARVEDLGRMPLPSSTTVGRDGGQGGLLGGKLLFTFGDTFTTAPNPVDHSKVLSATGGWSAPGTPLTLEQPVDAQGFPAQLIPYSAVELAQNERDPLNGWALWPGALFDTGSPEGLLIFQRVKRTSGSGFESQGIGTARIAVGATVATRAAADLFAPPEPLFVPTSVVDDTVYAFACASTGFLDIGCKVGRAPRAHSEERAAYTFYDGATWQGDSGRAVVVLDHVGGGLTTVSKNPYLGRYLDVHSTVLSSTVRLRTAERIEGPWSAPVELPPDGGSYLTPSGSTDYNYLIVEHPELRSADGRSIVLSYSRPTDPFRGDVRLMRITFR